MSNAVLLAQHNQVVAIDIVPAMTVDLGYVAAKVYTRDLFGQD